MLKSFLILVQILFIAYYAYVCFVFYKLYENTCSCKKLEAFKETWNFKYVSVVSTLFLLFNMYQFMNVCCSSQVGGKNEGLYYQTLMIVSLGYAASFVNDYALLDLFGTMEKKNCPCQTKHRDQLTKTTYVKLGANVLFYIHFMGTLDKKMFDALLKKIKKQQKSRS